MTWSSAPPESHKKRKVIHRNRVASRWGHLKPDYWRPNQEAQGSASQEVSKICFCDASCGLQLKKGILANNVDTVGNIGNVVCYKFKAGAEWHVVAVNHDSMTQLLLTDSAVGWLATQTNTRPCHLWRCDAFGVDAASPTPPIRGALRASPSYWANAPPLQTRPVSCPFE